MIPQINKAAREATERDLDGWQLTNGTPPGMKSGTMLCIVSNSGKPYAIGCGDTDLEAVNALVADMVKRARKWIYLLRMVKTWRDALRQQSKDEKVEKSAAFLAGKKNSLK